MHDMARRRSAPRLWAGVRTSRRMIWAVALPLMAGLTPAATLVHAGTPAAPIVPTTSALSSHPASPSLFSPNHRATAARPCLSIRADGLSFSLGSVAALGARAISTDIRDVPPTGLDRSGIGLGVDRRSIHTSDDGLLRWSDRSVTVALALPAVLALARDPRHPDMRGLAARFLLYAEASLFNDVATTALKASVARPRPVLYHDPWDGPSRPSGWNFESMPSGHASRSWCAASFALVDYLYSRPGAGTWEDAAVGFAAGTIAAATAALRVRGGVHFPSDALAGAGIGVACGVGVPLLHGYRRNGQRIPTPGGHHWLTAVGGMAAGAFVGIGTARFADGS